MPVKITDNSATQFVNKSPFAITKRTLLYDILHIIFEIHITFPGLTLSKKRRKRESFIVENNGISMFVSPRF